MLISLELQLLLICLHRDISPEQRKQVEQLQDHVDQTALLELATEQGVATLLYRGLRQIVEFAPTLKSITEQLTDLIVTEAVLYEHIYPQQLASILALFNEYDIDTLVIKGPVLGQIVYEQPSLRPYGDIDIAVHEKDLDAAEQVVRDLGYEPATNVRPAEWYREYHHHLIPFVHSEKLVIEIHWQLTHGVGLSMQDVWAHAQPLEIEGIRTKMLSPEHRLIYLCVHAVNSHRFDMGLKPLCDVYETLATHTLDWEMIAELCEASSCSRHVYLFLKVVQTFFNVEGLPEDGLNRLEHIDYDPQFIEYGLANILAGEKVTWAFLEVTEQGTPADLVALGFQKVFPPRWVVARHFQLDQNWSRWIYYPRWQLGLAGRFIQNVIRYLSGNRQIKQNSTLARRLDEWLNKYP